MPIILAALNEISGHISQNLAGGQNSAAQQQEKVDIGTLPPQLQQLVKDHGQRWQITSNAEGTITVMQGERIIGQGSSSMLAPHHDAVATALFQALDFSCYGNFFVAGDYQSQLGQLSLPQAVACDKDISVLAATTMLKGLASDVRDSAGFDEATPQNNQSRLTSLLAQLEQPDQFAALLSATTLGELDAEAAQKLALQAKQAISAHDLRFAFDEVEGETVVHISRMVGEKLEQISTTPLSADEATPYQLAKLAIAAGTALETTGHVELHGSTPEHLPDGQISLTDSHEKAA